MYQVTRLDTEGPECHQKESENQYGIGFAVFIVFRYVHSRRFVFVIV